MVREVKVGLFVILGLGLAMLAVFIIGSSRRLWEPRVTYRTAFQDVAGLKPGAPVRMGGPRHRRGQARRSRRRRRGLAHLRHHVGRRERGRAHPRRHGGARRGQGPARRQDDRAVRRFSRSSPRGRGVAPPVRRAVGRLLGREQGRGGHGQGHRAPRAARAAARRSEVRRGHPRLGVRPAFDARRHRARRRRDAPPLLRSRRGRPDQQRAREPQPDLGAAQRDAGGRARRRPITCARGRASRTRSSTTGRCRRAPPAPCTSCTRTCARSARATGSRTRSSTATTRRST